MAWNAAVNVLEASNGALAMTGDGAPPSTTDVKKAPVLQLIDDAADFARALARSYRQRSRPGKRGRLHRV